MFFPSPSLTLSNRGAILGLITGVLLCGTGMGAENFPPSVKIATFLGDRSAALSYTFDDGLREQGELIAPLLERLGLRGTFYVVASLTSETEAEAREKPPGEMGSLSWERLRELAQAGHEIGNHTWSHRGLTKVSDTEAAREIELGYERITERIGAAPLTFCFPGSKKNDRTCALALSKHIAFRAFQKSFGTSKFKAVEANAWLDQLVARKEWGVVVIHGILNGYDAFGKIDQIEAHFTHAATKKDQIWIDTFAKVSTYIQARDRSSVKVLDQTAEFLELVIENNLDSRYDTALTLIVEPAPPGEVSVRYKETNESIAAVRRGSKLLLDVKPGPRSIVVSRL